MSKKFLYFIAAIFIAFSANASGADNVNNINEKSGNEDIGSNFKHQVYSQSDSKTSEQLEVAGDWAPNEEVNTIQESELAREMMQAQKAQDAETYDKFGGGITIIAMCIVISALAVLSVLFMVFGKISEMFMKRKKKQAVSRLSVDNKSSEDNHSIDSGEVMAAIAAALAQHFSGEHDVEDTILTIRRMRKAYSPWNSKIYNLRSTPQVEHTHVKMGNR